MSGPEVWPGPWHTNPVLLAIWHRFEWRHPWRVYTAKKLELREILRRLRWLMRRGKLPPDWELMLAKGQQLFNQRVTSVTKFSGDTGQG